MNPPNLAFRPPYAPYLAAPHVLRGFAPIQQQQQQQRQSFSPSPVTAAQPHPITNSSNNQSQLLNVGVIPNQSEPRLDPNDFPALGAPTQQSQQQNQYSQASAPATLNQDDFPALSSDQSALNGVQSKSGDSIRQPYFPSNSSRTPAPSASQRDKRNYMFELAAAQNANPQQQQQQNMTMAQTPAQQVLISPADRFGLLGLLNIIRMSSSDMGMLALGSDLTNLGLDLSSPTMLNSTFVSPFSDNNARDAATLEPEFTLPACYNVQPPPPAFTKVAEFHDETLFYIFYTHTKDVMQQVAAIELFNRNWRYHKDLGLWLTKETGSEPVQKTPMLERGSYIFFDPKSWEKIKREFVLVYDQLEERPAGGKLSNLTNETGSGGSVAASTRYAHNAENPEKTAKARGQHLRTHFKNTREVAAAITGLKLSKAYKYLGDVQEHKDVIPFRRFNGGVGRAAQAKNHGTTQGRWPVKSIGFLLRLLKNAEANADAKSLDTDDLLIKHIVVQQAPKTRRRTYRAHGRINPYQGNPCHIEITLAAPEEQVARNKDVDVNAPKKILGNKRQVAAQRRLISA
ncbi:hypothetical protein E3Q23_03727 [Wallemia mellicola]|nr:hypothetical protein E3Q23_03727 [Wallemia mellicola]TIC72792.1 hypothetical protein E3Q00_03614 [Wallemia mellicola]